MPLKLEIKRKLSARSDRVKCVDIHPTEPWMLAALFNGNVHLWNIDSQQLIKSFEICDLPVRAAKFVARKNWVVTGSDDMQLRIFNYNTLERVHHFEAHSDYLRSIAVHPTQSFLLTTSDDMLIKLWDWDRQWSCVQVFEGHSHYVMQLVVNPKDNNTFATASLDKTVKVWSLGQPHANFTLEGHERGVNCVDYYSGGDKPYLVSGADDRCVKIWDYQTKTCVQTLDGHSQNVSCVSFHPELPIILSGSEDGTVRVWHANTYRLESTLNYGMERVWAIGCLRGSNTVVLGYDEGTIVIKLGREEPAMSMDNSGKIVFARHTELQQTNVRGVVSSVAASAGDDSTSPNVDGERLSVSVKNMGTCDIYPQNLLHNANGRFVVVCGDGEYIVYTAMALRNKSFGQAQEFVWAQQDASMFAIREGSSIIKIFKNFKECRSLKPDLGVEQIFGGWLLAVRSSMTALSFYDWENGNLIRRIELTATPRSVHWNEPGQLVAIVSEETTFLLRYFADVVRDATAENFTEDGLETAFDVLENGELNELVKTLVWVGDCVLYTNAANRLQYYVGGEVVTVAHLDRPMYLLGYLPKENRAYLGDRDVNIVSYQLLLSVLEYQTAVMRQDFATADTILPCIPRDQRTRVAHFLERRGFPAQALAVTNDPEHKFDLALQLGKLQVAHELASQEEEGSGSMDKWKRLAEAASRKSNFAMAQECLSRAGDHAALLLLASSCGNDKMMQSIAAAFAGAGPPLKEAVPPPPENVAFLARFLLQDLDGCIQLLVDSGRLPEAALFARAYLPSRVPALVELWREKIRSVSATVGQGVTSTGREKLAQALANPEMYENLFPGWRDSIKVEDYLQPERATLPQAKAYVQLTATPRDAFAEMIAVESQNVRVFDNRTIQEKNAAASLPDVVLKTAENDPRRPTSPPPVEVQSPAVPETLPSSHHFVASSALPTTAVPPPVDAPEPVPAHESLPNIPEPNASIVVPPFTTEEVQEDNNAEEIPPAVDVEEEKEQMEQNIANVEHQLDAEIEHEIDNLQLESGDFNWEEEESEEADDS